MGKPRDLANVVATGNILADGAVAPAELTGVNATAAEINILDGVTATATELNLLDGVTATTAELNHVDGVTSNVQTQMDTKAPVADPTFTGTATAPTVNASTALQIGGVAVTATAAELNVLDGITASVSDLNGVVGINSNVQTQLNLKAPIDGATFTGTTTIPTADINGGAIDGAIIGANSAAAVTATTVNASTKLQVNSTDVITNARALNNITSIDSTTADAITAAGVGGSDPITYYSLTSDNVSTSAKHFDRTSYLYIQQGTKVYVWDKTNKTASVTTITGLNSMDFISDTLAVGTSTSGIFKITVSGTTLTKGTQADLPSTSGGYSHYGGLEKAVGLSSTQAAILTCYWNPAPDYYFHYAFAAVDISGSTPSIGTLAFYTTSNQYQNINWHGARARNGNQFIATGNHGHSTGNSFTGLFHVSGTTLNHTVVSGQTGSNYGPNGSDMRQAYPYNQGYALSYIPNAANEGYFVGAHLSGSGYPNLAATGFANTTSATSAGFTILSPSGAPQCSNSYLNRVSAIPTTTNNGQYYILQYQAYAVSAKTIYRAIYRVQSGTTVSVNNGSIISTNPHTTDTDSYIHPIASSNTFLNFFDARGSTSDNMQAQVRFFTVDTSNHAISYSARNNLPTSGSIRSTMCTIPTQPLVKGSYLYNFETDFYAKSNDLYATQTPGRINAYIPYESSGEYGVGSVRVVSANLAIVFDQNGTKIVEVTE